MRPGARTLFQLSQQGQSLVEASFAGNVKYSRGGGGGEGFLGVDGILKELDEYKIQYYSAKEREALLAATQNVQSRMRIKVSKQYFDHALQVPQNAKRHNPILDVVMPKAEEVDDVAGEADPSNQNQYRSIPGLLHKYEMLLAYVSINCSSHCRYCYRSDLFSGISSKSKGDINRIGAYVRTYNEMIKEAQSTSSFQSPVTGLIEHREAKEALVPIREILFSGGDPLTLPNATILRYLAVMAESGIKTVRIGTKEVIFNPSRFDENFFFMLDQFHDTYPEVRIELVGHYTHPFELVQAKTNEKGEYAYSVDEKYTLRRDLVEPLDRINARRSWLGHHNQFPIIAGINDRPEVLRLILYLSNKFGITPHNVYACREIIGNAHFRQDNDIASQYRMLERAKVGLSGLENHGRLIMSTEFGKIEVMGVRGTHVYMRLNRFLHSSLTAENTFFSVDTSKLEAKSLYWLDGQVLNSDALDDSGRQLFQNLKELDSGFIRGIKSKAAEYVMGQEIDQMFPPPRKAAAVKGRKTTEIIVNGAVPETRFQIDLTKERQGVTLANILARHGFVEAACDCKLSCSTCVGSVSSSHDIGPPSEDELDVIDMMDDAEDKGLRAACQVVLRPGGEYSFKTMSL